MIRRDIFAAALLLVACGAKSGPDMDVILASKPAPTLAAYGLFEDAGANQPVQTVTAYDLVNPLFSDYADKHRFVYVPKGQQAVYHDKAVFSFPVGTVLIKTFGYKGKGAPYKIETRLLIHKTTGWTAYPYVWNDEQTEAVYAPVGARKPIKFKGQSFTYKVPSKNQCKTCHQSGHDIEPIGPKARNLNHNGQIEAWVGLGILNGAPENVSTVAEITDPAASLESRARAYLDINCAHCHKPDGSASNSGLWLDWHENSPTKLGLNKHPTAAGRGSGTLKYVIAPGHPERSILTLRMASTAPGIAMPELGRALNHDEGITLVNDWIASLPPTQND